eukprot:160559-Alexandrium_andersonii.AAC.1
MDQSRAGEAGPAKGGRGGRSGAGGPAGPSSGRRSILWRLAAGEKNEASEHARQAMRNKHSS